MTLLPARRDLALCSMSRHCPVRDRCYRSPLVRAQAVGEAQNWMEATPAPDGPCPEFWADGEARYITADQAGQYEADGWSVARFIGHHGVNGYYLATREA